LLGQLLSLRTLSYGCGLLNYFVAGCPSLNLLVWTYRGNKFKPIVMSDCDKGLLNAEKAAIPSASLAYCAWHLVENIKKKFEQKA
jgi:hypothetical protein